jgi:Ca2+-binding EF-hand superfamily protein
LAKLSKLNLSRTVLINLFEDLLEFLLAWSETMKRELKDAFRIYDKEGQGYITTETLRGLISELLSPLTDDELDGIIEELDEDGSGTMDFDEFCEMMMSAPAN